MSENAKPLSEKRLTEMREQLNRADTRGLTIGEQRMLMREVDRMRQRRLL